MDNAKGRGEGLKKDREREGGHMERDERQRVRGKVKEKRETTIYN